MASKAIGFLNFKFGADLSQFERAMNKAQKKLKKFGNQLQKTGKSMTMGLTLPIVALGGAAIKTFADFEQGMLKVKAVSGATAADFKLLTESAKELGASTMFSASQVATLQFELSKLGLDPTEILASTESILQLAQATDTELGEAAKTTAIALNSFNAEASEAQRFTDIMALASSSAAMDMEKFAAALPVVGATSRLAGDSFEELAAKLQVLADSGMEGGSMGTHLNKIYSKLAKSGLTWDEGMQKLIDSNFDMVLAQEMFGDRAFKSALILAENIDKTKQYTIANKEAQGTASEMAEIMDSGVAGAMRRLKSQTEGLLIQLGTALMPVFQKMMGALSSLVEWFSGLSKEQKDNIVKWGLILAALGPVLIIIGKISTGIGALIGMFKGLVKFLVANPYIALAAGIALVVAQIGKLILEYDGLTTTQRTLNSINKTAQTQTIAQQVEVGRLTDILKDENTTLEDKERALQDLNDIAPEYYGHLDAAAIDVKALTSATEDYIDTLLTQAKVQAAQETLVDLMKEQLDLQKQYKELTGTKAVVKSVFSAIMPSVGLDQSADLTKVLLRSKSIAEDISAVINVVNTGKKKLDETSKESITTTEEEINISNDLLILIEKLEKAQSKLHDAEPDYDKAVKSTTSLTLATKDLVFEAEKVALMAPSISSSIEEMFPTKPLSEFSGELGRLGENMNFLGLGTIPDLEEALGSMAVQLGNNLAQGAESFKEYATAVKGMMKDVIGALISKGIAAAVSNAMEGMAAFPGSAFVIPIIAGAAAGIARTAFNSLIPEFAAGGLVTGPTTALIGEGSGTSMANPEVVAPLDKLKQYMGGGSNVTVTGRLVGNDIYLSNERTKFNRNRTV